MSRKSWGNGLVDTLEQLGVIDEKAAEAVIAAKEQHPDEATGDLIVKMGIATEQDVERATQIQKVEGPATSDLLVESMQRARSRLASVARASVGLATVAASIAEKKS